MMWWHKTFHKVSLVPVISVTRPRLWICACGKQWHPEIRQVMR